MAESSIITPEAVDGPAVATDEVDERHFQGVKVHGGGVGVTNELHVDAAGRLLAGSRTFSRGFAFVSGIDSVTDYDAGDVVGASDTIEGLPVGMYAVSRLLVSSAGGLSLPDGLRVVLLPFDPSDPIAFGGDGDPYTPADARLLYSLVFDPAEYGGPGVARAELTAADVILGLPAKGDGSFGAGTTYDLRVILVTTTGSPAEPTEVGIAVAVVVEFLGGAPIDLDA